MMETRTSIAAKGQQKAMITRLQQVSLLSKCSASYLQLMLKAAKPYPFEAGDILCEQGAERRGVFVLLKGTLVVRREGEVTGRIEPVASAGDVSTLTGMPSAEEVGGLEAGLALHIPYKVFEILLSRDAELCHRMTRHLIAEFSARLQAGNEALGGVADRRADLEHRLQAAKDELNDLRMLHSMRGGDE